MTTTSETLRSFDHHPCFNVNSRHTHARIHLPVAPICNVQCNFCNRKYSCVNESRPGVTASVMTPEQALDYLKKKMKVVPNIAVAGIAGPGDPFANPEETLYTFRLIRERFPKMLLCVSSNGLNIVPYIDELAALKVSHVTITVNAVLPEVGAEIYSWVGIGNQKRLGRDGADWLWRNQRAAIEKLVAHGILVKINTVCIPGENASHIHEVTRTVADLGAMMQNIIPILPTAGTPFAYHPEPTAEQMKYLRAQAKEYLPQMEHCSRCRADAVGLLGQSSHSKSDDPSITITAEDSAMNNSKVSLPILDNTQVEIHSMVAPIRDPEKFIAVASGDGSKVNEPLGEIDYLLIYDTRPARPKLMGLRRIPPATDDGSRWETLAGMTQDCSMLLVGGIGPMPKLYLEQAGMLIRTVRGPVSDLLAKVDEIAANGDEEVAFTCGDNCHGDRQGCGCENF